MILINGELTDQVSAMDRGLQYGDGLFETIAVKNCELELWSLHWARLQKGCHRLGITVPDENFLLSEIEKVKGTVQQAVIKLLITRGVGGRGYRYTNCSPTRVVMRSPWPGYDEKNSQGIDVFICDTRVSIQPKLAGIKHLNRLENVMARNEWQEERFAEGLMLSTQDDIIEGTMSNIFLVKNQKLLTPDLSDCGVQGVMREHILNLAIANAINTQITKLQMGDIMSADEMFVCNSLIGIWPVKNIGDKSFDGQKEVTQKLQQFIGQR